MVITLNNFVINLKDNDKTILYTPEFEYINTPEGNRYEVTLIKNNDNYLVSAINNKGNNKIPLNGIVVSFINNPEININDEVIIDNFNMPTYFNSLVDLDGKRCVIHCFNRKHYGNEIVLLDRQYSVFSQVYSNYYELILKLDSIKRGFIVSSLKHKKYEKQLAREIDKGSYVLLCADSNNMLTRFKEDQEVFFEIPLIELEKKITFNYTAYNPKPGKKVNFDATFFGFRAPDTCMIYDINGYHVDKTSRLTGTNPWGYEVAVDENGIIVETAINAKIPENGYVISGVSDYYTILKNDFKLGGKVKINKSKKQINYYYNHVDCCLSIYENMKQEINEIINNLNNLYDLDKSLIYRYLEKYENLKEKLENRKLMIQYSKDKEQTYHLYRFNNYFNKAVDYYHQLYKLSIQPSNVEVRACWHEPHEKSLQEVILTLDTLKASNFNELIVGGVMGNGVIFKSNKYPMSPFVKGYFGEEYKEDYLLCLTCEAKKRGIRIQVSSDNFFAVPFFLEMDYDKYYKLLALGYDGKIGQRDNGEITLFFDPVNKESQDLILDIYKEMLDNYDISGLQLDYIRYCIGNDNYLTAFGYNKDTTDKFKEEYNYQGDIKELVKDESIYKDFCDFRRKELTNFVKRVRKLLSNYNNVQLTIACVSEYEIARDSKLQDWTEWAKLDLLDGVYLMAYHLGKGPVYNDCIKAKELVGNHAFVYGGIAPIYNGCNINILLEQVKAIKDAKVDGMSLFAFHSFQNRPDLYYYFNNNGPFKNEAIPTYETKDKVIEIYCNLLLDRYERLYYNYISKKELDSIIDNIKKANNEIELLDINYISHPIVRNHIEQLKQDIARYLSITNNKKKDD